MKQYKNSAAKLIRNCGIIYLVLSFAGAFVIGGILEELGLGTKFEMILISIFVNGMYSLIFFGGAEAIELLHLEGIRSEQLIKVLSTNTTSSNTTHLYEILDQHNETTKKLLAAITSIKGNSIREDKDQNRDTKKAAPSEDESFEAGEQSNNIREDQKENLVQPETSIISKQEYWDSHNQELELLQAELSKLLNENEVMNEEKSNIAERTTIIELEKELFKLNNVLSDLSFIKKNEKEILNRKINEKHRDLSMSKNLLQKKESAINTKIHTNQRRIFEINKEINLK